MAKVANAAYPFSSASTVLDVGCGLGQVTDQVLKAYGSSLPGTARVVDLDFAPGMIEQVEKRKKDEIAASNTLWSKVETLLSNVTDLSAFADKSVSHIFAGFVYFLVPQSQTALKEAHRVLTDQHGGGVLALATWQGSEWQELMGCLNKVRPDKVMPMPPALWSDIKGVHGELAAAGFRDIDVHTVQTYMPLDTYDEIARFVLTKFPAMNQAISDMPHDEIQKVYDLMVAYLKEKHPAVPSRLSGTAIVGVGRK